MWSAIIRSHIITGGCCANANKIKATAITLNLLEAYYTIANI